MCKNELKKFTKYYRKTLKEASKFYIKYNDTLLKKLEAVYKEKTSDCEQKKDVDVIDKSILDLYEKKQKLDEIRVLSDREELYYKKQEFKFKQRVKRCNPSKIMNYIIIIAIIILLTIFTIKIFPSLENFLNSKSYTDQQNTSLETESSCEKNTFEMNSKIFLNVEPENE